MLWPRWMSAVTQLQSKQDGFSNRVQKRVRYIQLPAVTNGVITLPDLDSDSDSKPSGYIALRRSFHAAHNQIQIPILTANYRNGIGIRLRLP